MSSPAPSSSSLTQVSFSCQRCSRPLKLENSLQSVTLKNIAQVSGSATIQPTPDYITSPPINVHADDGVIRRVVIEHTVKDDFCHLTKPEPTKTEAFGYKLRVAMELFDILSETSEIDHPLCEECTSTLFKELDIKLRNIEEDCTQYRQVLMTLESDTSDTTAVDSDIEVLRAEEESLVAQLSQVSIQREAVAEELAQLAVQEADLDEEELQYHRDCNKYQQRLGEVQAQQECIDNELKYAHKQLELLKKTNIFNTVFHIWHDGHFGTINNFRLGRLPTISVEWEEVNAAWGQTALLLSSLAKASNFTFQKYKVVPFGSQSYVEGETKLPLYTTGGIRLFWDAKFDQGMVAFLDCLKQFLDSIEKQGTFNFPYKIDKSKIGDSGGFYSVKLHFNSEEQWTKALKLMLINLKWALTFVSSQSRNS